MDPFPLTTLLALRQREEEAAEADWAAALATLRAAEARLAALGDEIEAARRRLEEARMPGEKLGHWSASEVATQQRFLARRRDEWTASVAAQTAFCTGPLATARAAEGTARVAHAEKRRGREAVDKQKEQWLAETRREAERRAEDARDDLTAAVRHRRKSEE